MPRCFTLLTREDDGVDEVCRSDVLLVTVLRRRDGLHHHHATGSEKRVRGREEGSQIIMAHRFDLPQKQNTGRQERRLLTQATVASHLTYPRLLTWGTLYLTQNLTLKENQRASGGQRHGLQPTADIARTMAKHSNDDLGSFRQGAPRQS